MHRALVIISVFVAALLGTGLLVAAGPDAASGYYEEQEDVLFALSTEGFRVSVFAEDNDGDQTASLSISRDGLIAAYDAPAKITDHSVAAKFGSLGALNFQFKPQKGAPKCRGGLTFTGTFTFTGENGYVHVDADHAAGAGLEQAYSGCGGAQESLPKVTLISTDVHLEAIAGSWKHGTARKVEVSEYRTRGGRRSANISAFVREEREGMIVARGAMVTARPGAFKRDLRAGTATLTPGGPFTGSATLTPGRGEKGIWEGSLQVPVLDGGEPIVLTGPDFSARLYEEQPFDE